MITVNRLCARKDTKFNQSILLLAAIRIKAVAIEIKANKDVLIAKVTEKEALSLSIVIFDFVSIDFPVIIHVVYS
jgi:hypothetical protein